MVLFSGCCKSENESWFRRVLTPAQRLQRIEVIEDDESDIVEAVRRLSHRYDFVVTRYEYR